MRELIRFEKRRLLLTREPYSLVWFRPDNLEGDRLAPVEAGRVSYKGHCISPERLIASDWLPPGSSHLKAMTVGNLLTAEEAQALKGVGR